MIGRCVSAVLLAAALASPAAAADAISIDVRARAVQPGELVVLVLTAPAPVTAVQVRAFNRTLPAIRVGDRAWRALIGIDLDVAPGAHVVTVDATPGSLHATRTLH